MRLFRFRNIVIVLVGVMVVSCSGDSRDVTVERVGVEVPAMDLANPVHTSTRESLEQLVGVERTRLVAELITDHVGSIFPYVEHLEHMRLELRRKRGVQGNSTTCLTMSGRTPGLQCSSDMHSMRRTTPEAET